MQQSAVGHYTIYHATSITHNFFKEETMLGNQGLTAAKFDTNIRALRGTVMSLPVSNPSTESDFYVGLPSGFNTVPTGVLSQDVVEPGYPLTSELWLDPNTSNPINGTAPPSPFVSQGRAWGLIISAAGGGSDRRRTPPFRRKTMW